MLGFLWNHCRSSCAYHHMRVISASQMFVENRAENFETRMRRLIYGFRERLNASRNSLVICLVKSVAWSSSGLRQKWEKCLYIFFKPSDVCKMLFIYNRILLIFLLNAVSNCTLHAFQVYFPHVLFSPFFVILHYHCIYYVFKYGILCISRHVLWKPAIKIYYY